MRESFVRDRTGDDGSAAGEVDKSVVNWLMHVISGRAPTGLGLNDAPEAESGEASQKRKLASRDAAKENAAPPAPSMNITAEDLCGAPVVPLTPGPVAYEPIVYEVVTGDDEILPEPTFSSSHEEVPMEVAPEPERGGLLSFKRPTGPQLVDTGRAQVLPPVTNQSLAVQLLRDDAPLDSPPATEVTRSIANSLRAGLAGSSETKAEPIDPLDLTRDPDYYEEKLRARESSTKVSVEWEPIEPAAPAFKAEPDLVQVVKHEAPIAATHVDAFAGVAESRQAAPQVGAVSVAPGVEAASPEAAPVAATMAEPVAPAALTTPDPFAGFEFGTTPAPEELAVAEVAGAPTIADPFAGVEFGTAAVPAEIGEPIVAVAAPEIVAAEVEVAAAPEAVSEPVIEAVDVAEPEAAVAPHAAEVLPEEPADFVQLPEVVEAPAEAEVVSEAEVVPAAAEAEVVPVAEAPVRSWSWMVPEAPPVAPEIAARATQDGVLKPVIAAEVSQPQVPQPGKAVAEASAAPSGEAKAEDLSAAIKTLMQLGSVLPLATRMAPREGEVVQEPVAVDTQEVKQEVSGLRLLQYEIKTTVQDQSMHLKRLEDQLARMRESAEMDSAESASAMDNMKSTAKMVRVMGIGLGVMLMVLILLIGMVLMHVK